jgi:hypothetical protein
MAKRRKEGEVEIPFVALMDTLTNVVGVLTIVFVMVGLGLANAVNKIMSSLPPATEEQVRAAQTRLDQMRTAKAPDQTKLKDLEKLKLNPADLKKLDSELERLKREAASKGIKLPDLEPMRKELTKRDAELKQKKTAMEQLLTERDRLKGLLDTTPMPKAPPAKIVRIPASRPIPENAVMTPILVTSNGVHAIDVEGAKKAFITEVMFIPAGRVPAQTVKRGNKTVMIYDSVALAKYFDFRKPVFREFQIEMAYVSWGTSPVINLRLRPGAVGTSLADLRQALMQIKRTANAVAMFYVMPDGFENYLVARQLCDEMAVPAGWEHYGSSSYQIYVREVETNRPKPPPTPPKPADQIDIKQPSKKLD